MDSQLRLDQVNRHLSVFRREAADERLATRSRVAPARPGPAARLRSIIRLEPSTAA